MPDGVPLPATAFAVCGVRVCSSLSAARGRAASQHASWFRLISLFCVSCAGKAPVRILLDSPGEFRPVQMVFLQMFSRFVRLKQPQILWLLSLLLLSVLPVPSLSALSRLVLFPGVPVWLALQRPAPVLFALFPVTCFFRCRALATRLALRLIRLRYR